MITLSQYMPQVSVTSKNNIPEELKLVKVIKQLIKKHKLKFFTNKIVVEHNVISHSHPVLTISTKYMGKPLRDPDRVLALLVHENLHWNEPPKHILRKLDKEFPEAKSKRGGTLHLALIYQEYEQLKQYLPNPDKLFNPKDNPYSDIVKMVFDNYDKIGKII